MSAEQRWSSEEVDLKTGSGESETSARGVSVTEPAVSYQTVTSRGQLTDIGISLSCRHIKRTRASQQLIVQSQLFCASGLLHKRMMIRFVWWVCVHIYRNKNKCWYICLTLLFYTTAVQISPRFLPNNPHFSDKVLQASRKCGFH